MNKKKAYEADIESAKLWLVGVGADLLLEASLREDRVTRIVELAMVVAECAALPGDMPLRVRLFPGAFTLEA